MKITTRVDRLSPQVRQEFANTHIPGRVSLIRDGLEAVQKGPRRDFYYHLTVVAVASRALAQFLGLGLDRAGKLATDNRYFPHETDSDRKKKSYEVKVTDVFGIPLLTPNAFSPEDQHILQQGFDTINREVAHITHWDVPSRHHSHTQEISQDAYHDTVIKRICGFAEIIVREVEAVALNDPTR